MILGIATSAANPSITASDLLAAHSAARLLDAQVVPVPWDVPSPPYVDALLIRSTWGYHHHVAEFEAWLKGLTCRVLNPVPLMLGNLNKIYLAKLAAQGVPVVPTVFFSSIADLPAWPELVVKPAVFGIVAPHFPRGRGRCARGGGAGAGEKRGAGSAVST